MRFWFATTERDRLEALHPPRVTPQIFERCLPYAIALDCENEWSRKFEMQAEAAAAETLTVAGADSGYAPDWCSGRSPGAEGVGFASGLGVSLAASAAMAATAPGSVSGSGGGGSSGGGGGGGGGW